MLLSALNRLKIRLQFTGWLQYAPPAVLSLICFLAGAAASLLGCTPGVLFFVLIGGLLLTAALFDLVTVKFRLRPAERLPKRNDDLGMFDLIRARRSCRSFQLRKLTPADHAELMDSVRRHSAEPRLGRAAVRFEYIAAPLTVWPVVNASEFLVAIGPAEYDRLAVIDVGRSLQKVVIDATRMGLGTCWIGPGADQSSIIRRLGGRFDPQQDHIICVCAVGYKSGYLPAFLRFMRVQFHRRLPLAKLFFADPGCTQPLNVTAPPFNRFGRCYEICQWSPSSFNGQPTRCAAVTEQNDDEQGQPRLVRFDFYAATASRYYAAVALGIWCANWEMGCAAQGILGHFALLPESERGLHNEKDGPHLPRYDMSWVLDEQYPAEVESVPAQEHTVQEHTVQDT